MRYDSNTALIVVDMQNDFAMPDGNLSVTGGQEVIGFVNEQIRAAVEAGAMVVLTQDWHPDSTPHFEKDGGIWPVHCVGGTPGAELHRDLEVPSAAIRVRKGVRGEDGYSAFSVRDPIEGLVTPTGLAGQLRDHSIQRVVVVGLALDYCVKETALDAAAEGFDTGVLADGTMPVNLMRGDGARAVATLVAAGVEVS